MKKIILLALLGSTFLTVNLFAGTGHWLTNFEKAKTISAETGKPIFANFSGSDWCTWCIKLDKEVLNKKNFLNYAEKNLVLLQIDFPQHKKQTEKIKEQNAELMHEYGVKGFPTVLILDKDGKVIGRTGYRPGGSESYVKYLVKLLKDHKPSQIESQKSTT